MPASIDVRLERGAAISGTVLYDDGSPAAGLPVRALVRRKQGDKEIWSPLRSSPFFNIESLHTDDLGHYRLVGLSARDYLVEIDLNLQSFQFGFTPGSPGGSSSVNEVASLAFYSGSVTRKSDARPVKVSAGDEAGGEDLTIPLSKLHTITGQLAATRDGHLLNAGQVKVIDSVDKTEMETAKVDRTDGRFHLVFIPEGDYVLRVDNAADAAYEDVPNPPGTMPPSSEKVNILRRYGTADQPIHVQDDASSLVIPVPDTATTSRAGVVSQ